MQDEHIKAYLKGRENVEALLPRNITLETLLPAGGQGVVYRGKVNGVDAAIKIYYPGQVEVRIKREIEALSTLDNPNIVKLLWESSLMISSYKLQAVATTLIPGIPLDQKIELSPIDHSEIGMIAYDIANAIKAMWDLQFRIVHRDLKPPNILIKPDKRACVIDLGVARHIDQTPLTATGYTWGTSGYMSPEQTRALRQLTCKSDIFALGVIMVECALGRHPTRHDQIYLLEMGLHEKLPIELATWDYANILKDMLHPRPTKRPLPQDVMNSLKSYAPQME